MKHIAKFACFDRPRIALHMRPTKMRLSKGKVKESSGWLQQAVLMLNGYHLLNDAIHLASYIV